MKITKEQLREEAFHVRELFTDLAKWAEQTDNTDLFERYQELIAMPDGELLAYARRHDIRGR